MNFRTTILFFGLLLTCLFVFGLMIAHKKGAVDQTAVVPTLAEGKVDKIVIKHPAGKGKEAATLEFVQRGDRWYFTEKNQSVRVETYHIKGMIDAIKDARQEEPVETAGDLALYGLDRPQLTVVLSGKLKDDTGKLKDEPKEWTFFVGKERPGASMYYVNSSEKDQKAYAVPKRGIDALFVTDVATLRAKRLFDFVASSVTGLDIQKGKEKLDIKKQEGNIWVYVEPKLGFLNYDSGVEPPAPPEDKNHPFKKKTPKEEPASGVKALLDDVVKLTVEDNADFVPLGSPMSEFDLVDDKTAPMKIEIRTTEDAKNTVTETLLVGKKIVKDKQTYYYARLSYDEGVFKISDKFIKPIDEALADPGKLRSLDVAFFDPKGDKKETRVDSIYLKTAKDEAKFFFPEKEDEPWEMFVHDSAGKKWDKKKASDAAVGKLLETLVGKKAIVSYLKLDDADKDKKLAEWGLKTPSAEVAAYINVVERPKKDEKEKKDDKDKKNDKDKKDQLPELKKDAKPVVKLEFGTLDKDGNYPVRRTLENGVESYFLLKQEYLDKIAPKEGVELAYLDTALPGIPLDDIVSVSFQGTTDKGKEPVVVERLGMEGQDVWYVKDPLEKPNGLKLAEGKTVEALITHLATFRATKWVKKIAANEELDTFGLKNPNLVVTFQLKKQPLAAATLLGALAGDASVIAALGTLVGEYQNENGHERVVIEFGKEAYEDKGKDKEKQKLGVYARDSKSDLLFIVPDRLVKQIKDADLRDRAALMHVQARLLAAQIGITAGDATGAWMFLSPYFSGAVNHFDAEKIKEVHLTIRTPVEVRSFAFERAGKGKDATWFDRTPGLVEFHLDSDKVAKLVKDFSDLRSERFVAVAGGQRGEHKLGSKDFTAKLDFTTDEGRVITVLIGGSFQNQGFYAVSSYWPQSEAVFMVPAPLVAPLLQGVQYFAKERGAVN